LNDKIKKYDIAFTAGVFDLFHFGHKKLLEMMKSKADYTIVFLHDDFSTYQNKNKFPVQNFRQRMENLEMTGLVDGICEVKESNPGKMFKTFLKVYGKNVIYVRGNDWKNAPGLDVIKNAGVKIHFKKYTAGISSTKLRDKLSK
jgi:glycerol-3-phosphate cytidylyltransferase